MPDASEQVPSDTRQSRPIVTRAHAPRQTGSPARAEALPAAKHSRNSASAAGHRTHCRPYPGRKPPFSFSALRAHTKAPYKIDLLWRTLRALDHPSQGRTAAMCAAACAMRCACAESFQRPGWPRTTPYLPDSGGDTFSILYGGCVVLMVSSSRAAKGHAVPPRVVVAGGAGAGRDRRRAWPEGGMVSLRWHWLPLAAIAYRVTQQYIG